MVCIANRSGQFELPDEMRQGRGLTSGEHEMGEPDELRRSTDLDRLVPKRPQDLGVRQVGSLERQDTDPESHEPRT